MNINFNLKNKKEDFTLIIAVMRWNGKKSVMSVSSVTSCPKVNPSNWNTSSQKAKGQGAKDINFHVSRFRRAAEDAYYELSKNSIPDGHEIKERIKAELDDNYVNSSSDFTYFLDYMDFFIEQMRLERKVPTIKTYLTCRSKFVRFKKKRKYRFSDMDRKFVNDFSRFMLSEQYAASYISKCLSVIKTILTHAYDNGHSDYRGHDNKWFGYKKSKPKTAVYVTKAELQKLEDARLTDKKDRIVRDLFLIACETGLRYSDWGKLANLSLLKNVHIIRTKKTNTDVAVPITPLVRKIFERNGGMPHIYCEQYFNRKIKHVFDLVGINDEINYTEDRGGKQFTDIRKKSELVYAHTARRSFASNAYLAGVPISFISKILGHTTESQTLKYIKATVPDAVVNISQHPYFNQSIMRVAK